MLFIRYDWSRCDLWYQYSKPLNYLTILGVEYENVECLRCLISGWVSIEKKQIRFDQKAESRIETFFLI